MLFHFTAHRTATFVIEIIILKELYQISWMYQLFSYHEKLQN